MDAQDSTHSSPPAPDVFRTENGEVNRRFVHELLDLIELQAEAKVRAKAANLHESDLADLLEVLSSENRTRLLALLGKQFDANVLPELDEQIITKVVEELPNDVVVEAVRELESDDAIYVMESLEEENRDEILANIPDSERRVIESGLKYPEDSAGRMMQHAFVAIPSFWTVEKTITFLREDKNLPAKFSEIYVISATFTLRGVLSLQQLISTAPDTVLRTMLDDEKVPKVKVLEDKEKVARKFERYDLLSAPVVDSSKRLVGIITIDDIVDVIHKEAEEDILLMGGVGADTSLADSIWNTAKGRFLWLFINLLTALLASLVIKLFDATIEEMVALAVLMPIVASMGGNAATQTMTVAVRALSTQELSHINAGRIIWRETWVGLINGLIFAIILALLVFGWMGQSGLGLVIAVAMVLNLLIAGLSGIIIPLALDRYGIDPAVASSVFVTTITDVVGFFLFLGLAALFLV